MPFFLRKSISLGGLRVNLSKAGVGLSTGIKGLRIGMGPRGKYVQAGRGGLYYRKTLDGTPVGRINGRWWYVVLAIVLVASALKDYWPQILAAVQ